MKKTIIFALVLLVALGGCASLKVGDGGNLDAAIGNAAQYFTQKINKGAKIALLPFEAPTGRLSDYVFEELWVRFEDSQNFVMVDRRNLQRIDSEIQHQLESGMVDDTLAVSIGAQYGAQFLVFGQITTLSNEYRLTIYVTDVEKASSSQRSFMLKPDARLAALAKASLDDEVERAVLAMAKSVNQKTTVAVGRISYAGTDTVSGFSAWLKNSLVAGVQKQGSVFQVASDTESSNFAVSSLGLTANKPVTNSPIQAVISGSYSPLDNGAEVSLQLVSTGGNKLVLSSARFAVPASELERRKLSLLPEKATAVISKVEFEQKQKAIDPYAGKDNKWAFTVTPDVLDGIYYDGEYMTMRLHSEKECYFRIIQVDVDGNIQVIYPVSAADNNLIHAGETRRIPDNTRFKIGQPYGEEIILAAAYERKFVSKPISGKLSVASISNELSVEDANRVAMNPLATAKFNYTILPKNRE